MTMRWVGEVGLTDGLGPDDVFWWATGTVAVLAAFFMIARLLTPVRDFFMWWSHFRAEWDGTIADPGHDAVPGIPERMKAIDGEMSRNGGHSLKDGVFEAVRQADEVKQEQVQMRAELNETKSTVEEIRLNQQKIQVFLERLERHLRLPPE